MQKGQSLKQCEMRPIVSENMLCPWRDLYYHGDGRKGGLIIWQN